MNLIESILWLALNIYHESRSEPITGQYKVAIVTLNRSYLYNKSIKEVVLQPHQFSWTNKKNKYKIYEPEEFYKAIFISSFSIFIYKPKQPLILYYHNNTVNPIWTNSLQKVITIGNHIFYANK